MVVVEGRLSRWVRRLDRTAEAIDWFVRRVLPAGLIALCGLGLVWYSVLEFRTPDPWSGPDAMTDAFGWQVWAAGAAGITGLVGLLVIEYIRFALVTPVAVVSWILARFRRDDPLRRTVTHTRADILAPLRAAAHRPATWLFAAGGIVVVAVLAVGVSTLPGAADRRATPPPTAAETAAIEEQLRAKAAQIHAIIGAPPIREDLRLVGTQCHPGDRPPGDRSRSGFGYLGTRPGADPVDRMPQWAADLRARGWAVTHPYPVERRPNGPDNRLLLAVHDGFEVTIDARNPPDLWIEVRGLC
jgi:hypothetical protein